MFLPNVAPHGVLFQLFQNFAETVSQYGIGAMDRATITGLPHPRQCSVIEPQEAILSLLELPLSDYFSTNSTRRFLSRPASSVLE